MELLENVQYQRELDFKSSEEKIINKKETTNKNNYESYKYDKYEYIETAELPLPNIKNLRKWIKNEKKAS